MSLAKEQGRSKSKANPRQPDVMIVSVEQSNNLATIGRDDYVDIELPKIKAALRTLLCLVSQSPVTVSIEVRPTTRFKYANVAISELHPGIGAHEVLARTICDLVSPSSIPGDIDDFHMFIRTIPADFDSAHERVDAEADLSQALQDLGRNHRTILRDIRMISPALGGSMRVWSD